MKKIVLASKNPVKSRATLAAFERSFPDGAFALESHAVPSGVSDQPASDAETLLGARQRAAGARQQFPEADFWVGMEGGIEDDGSEMTAFAWMVVLAEDASAGQIVGKSRSASFTLPHPVAELVRQGKELGEADDLIFKRSGSKSEEGAVGLLTAKTIDRTELYEHAMILALIPFRHPHWYSPS